MPPDLWSLYAQMLRCRLFEEAVAQLWRDGLISGEMHLGTGEEAIVAGIVPQLLEGDALALDHRATAALLLAGVEPASILADLLAEDGISAGVLDLRTVSPLDRDALCTAVRGTGRLLVVDEDYEGFGLSGELAAVVLEAGISVRFARVCTQTTIPYARHLEDQVLPGVERIRAAAATLMENGQTQPRGDGT